MRPPLDGNPGVGTGWRYSDGDFHGAYDYLVGIGTPIFAIGDGVIIDTNDGVANNVLPRYTGMPSNWITLAVKDGRRDVTAYYQHLSPGLKVKPGQKVKEGQLLGHSGNSGNSSGPHLHFATMYGKRGEADRYIYMENDGDNKFIIYPPDKLWKGDEDMPLNAEDKQWIREQLQTSIDRFVWGHEVNRLEGLEAQPFGQTVSRWERTRGTAMVAKASAEATVKALQKVGLASGSIDAAAVADAVADEIAARMKE